MTTTITARDHTIEVSFTNRPLGGWNVVRADNGRVLGWVVRGSNRRWEGRVAESAFRGDGPDDEGDILDAVPGRLTNRDAPGRYDAIDVGRDRWEVTYGILAHLVRQHAPAVGFGRHVAVERWKGAQK